MAYSGRFLANSDYGTSCTSYVYQKLPKNFNVHFFVHCLGVAYSFLYISKVVFVVNMINICSSL